MTERKILEVGDIDRKKFKAVADILGSWEARDLHRLGTNLGNRRDVRWLMTFPAASSIAHLLDEHGQPRDSVIHGLLYEGVRATLLERAHARFLEAHPVKSGPKKRSKHRH